MPSIHEGFYGDSRLADAFFKLQRQAFPSLDLEEAYRRGLLDEKVVVPFGIFDDESHALSILNATSMVPETSFFVRGLLPEGVHPTRFPVLAQT